MPEEKPKRSRNGGASSSSKDKRLTSRIATAAALSWKQQCKDLVESLRQSEDAAPFLQPVNVLDVPDYLQVIDHPMDLQTVREELQVTIDYFFLASEQRLLQLTGGSLVTGDIIPEWYMLVQYYRYEFRDILHVIF